jgi:hypothetical protein
VVPAFNAGKAFLPASLTTLVVDFKEMDIWDDFGSERALVQAWLSWYGGPLQPSLQHLRLLGLKAPSISCCRLDFSRLPGLRELHFVPLDCNDNLRPGQVRQASVFCQIPRSLTQLSKLEVLQLAPLQDMYSVPGHMGFPFYGW